MTQNAWDNYWQGRVAQQTGASYVGVGVEEDPSLQRYWESVFTPFEKDAAIFDLASGAGSVLKVATSLGYEKLYASDFSASALQTLNENLPNVVCQQGALGNCLHDANSADLITSQFGIEYADPADVLKEIQHLSTDTTQFTALMHISGGAIEEEVNAIKAQGQSINDTKFISMAKELVEAAFQYDQDKIDENFIAVNAAFEVAAQNLQSVITEQQHGLAIFLADGFGQLYERRRAYDKSDIIGWLDGMQNEVDLFIARMDSMLNASRTETHIDMFIDGLNSIGYSDVSKDKLYTDEMKELAWIVKATK